jgi:imidazolonepropionase-like amidohydrolase
LTHQRPLPTLGEARAIVDEAHRLGMKVAVHLDTLFDEAVHLAVEAGADSLEHNAPLRVADGGKTLGDIARKGIFVVPGIGTWVTRYEPLWVDPAHIPEGPLRAKLPPTLVTAMQRHAAELRLQALEAEKQGFDPKKRRVELLAETRAAYAAGVVLAAGPDTGVDLLPHGRLYTDIEWFAEAGIPTEQVVRIATLNGARAAGIEKQTGSIEVGKDADLVVVRGDVTRDIAAIEQVVLVIRAGRIVFDSRDTWIPCTVPPRK